MTNYALFPGALTLSQFASTIETQQEAVRTMEAGAVEPTVKADGLLWMDTATGKIRRWDTSLSGGAGGWRDLLSATIESLASDGSVALTGDLDAGGASITNLAAASSNDEAPRLDQVVTRTGGQLTGNLDAGSNSITNLAAPSGDNDAARKVDARSIGDGLTHFNQTATQWQGTDGSDFERCGPDDARSFVPREIVFMLDGDVDEQDGGGNVGTIGDPEIHRTQRWENHSAPSTPGGAFKVAEIVVNAVTCELFVYYKFDAGVLGFYAWLRKQSNQERLDVEVFQVLATGRVDA